MRRDEASFLLDMLEAARKAVAFAADITYRQFEESDLHQHAVFKALEVIGEAAARLDIETKEAHPAIPWHEIVGTRNRIVHAYFDVNLGIVWRIVQEDLPDLIAQLEPLVPPESR